MYWITLQPMYLQMSLCTSPLTMYLCMLLKISLPLPVCVCVFILQHCSLSGATCVSYLLQVSSVKGFSPNCVYGCALMFSFLCFSAASFSCVFSFLFQSAIPLVRTETLFSLSNANPPQFRFFFNTFPHFFYTEVLPLLYTQTHTLFPLVTSNVVLSVSSSVRQFVVVKEEVLCNNSIGPIIGTKSEMRAILC